MRKELLIEVISELVGYTDPTDSKDINEIRRTNQEKIIEIVMNGLDDLIDNSKYRFSPIESVNKIGTEAHETLIKIKDLIDGILNLQYTNKEMHNKENHDKSEIKKNCDENAVFKGIKPKPSKYANLKYMLEHKPGAKTENKNVKKFCNAEVIIDNSDRKIEPAIFIIDDNRNVYMVTIRPDCRFCITNEGEVGERYGYIDGTMKWCGK